MNEKGASVEHYQPPLYGRKREVAFLREWSSSCASASKSGTATATTAGSTRLLLLGGPRGVGKGALARSLLRSPPGTKQKAPSATRTKAVFVSGRFHPDRAEIGQRPPPGRPMSAFWDALNHLFDTSDLPQCKALQSAILAEFREADDVETLMEMMPASKQWLAGKRGRSGTEMSAESALVRTGPLHVIEKSMLNTGSVHLAIRFVHVTSTCILPSLVLCLEHLDYADSATFELIDSLLGDTTIGGFLNMIATYRVETESSLALKQLLGRASDATTDSVAALHGLPQQMVKVSVGELLFDDMSRWTRHRFGQETMSEDVLQSVASLVYEKSSGNPQFAVYLIEFVDGYMKAGMFKEQAVEALRTKIPDCVNDLFSLAVKKPESGFSDVVELVAVLGECRGGESVELATLDLVLRRPFAVAVALAQKSGILVSTRALNGAVSFPCSEFQRVTYSMIPEARRVALHLKIGRRLWKASTPRPTEDVFDEGLASLLFLGAQNLQRSMELVTDLGELTVIANVSIGAGKRAMESSQFPLAVCYLELAISALMDRLWTAEYYDISLALYNGISEAYYCIANFDSAERSLDVVIRNATIFEDKLQAYSTLVNVQGAQVHHEEATSLATQVLRQVGEKFPSNPSTFQVLMGYLKIRRLFKGKSDRFFLSLPPATKPKRVTAMQLMSFTTFAAYAVRPKLGVLMNFRLLQSMLKHGQTGPAIVALAGYAYILSVYMGRMKEGARFAKLALAFLEQGDGVAWLPRVATLVPAVLYRFDSPYSECLELLGKAYCVALKAGDTKSSMCTSIIFHQILIHAGAPLRMVEAELRSHARMMDTLGQQVALTHFVPMWHFICALLGDVPYPLTLVGEITNTETALDMAREKDDKIAQGHFYLYQTIYCCLLGEYEKALDMVTRSNAEFRNHDVWLDFFEGFAALANARNSSVRAIRRQALFVGRKVSRSMKHLCRDNFGSKVALLEAELSAMKGMVARAYSLYNLSIELAKEQGFYLVEGLAYERLGHLQLTMGSNALAIPYYEAACRTYEQWGAQALVARMELQLQALRQ